MAQGVVTIAGNVSGGPVGSRSLSWAVPLASAVDQMQTIAVVNGANTVTVPSGTTYMVIAGPNSITPAPNPASSVTLTLKGVAGDTGIAFSTSKPLAIAFDTAPASVVINSTGSATVYVWFA